MLWSHVATQISLIDLEFSLLFGKQFSLHLNYETIGTTAEKGTLIL